MFDPPPRVVKNKQPLSDLEYKKKRLQNLAAINNKNINPEHLKALVNEFTKHNKPQENEFFNADSIYSNRFEAQGNQTSSPRE